MSAIGRRASRRSVQAGFTLIESLTVLAITAAIGAMSFPSLQHAIAAVTLVEAKQAFVADLRRARGRALAGAGPMRLVVAAGGRAYGWNGEALRSLPTVIQLDVATTGSIAFFADGSAEPGAVVLRSGGRGSRIVVAATGAVSVQPLPAQIGGGA
jgi:prepilin-type N-terminal cleavage/methylation domain-containing protein